MVDTEKWTAFSGKWWGGGGKATSQTRQKQGSFFADFNWTKAFNPILRIKSNGE